MNKGIDVEIIKDSTNWTGKRLTTFILKYPRYIHAELMTHRVFSKNSASSRAIPILKMIDNIREDMVNPIWTLNQSGMQGLELEDLDKLTQAQITWRLAFDNALLSVNALNYLGIHKQNVNRLLEPWMHIKIILTGTDFSNWFELRNHPDAQPEIQSLARKMLKAMEESTPQYLNPGEWHIPFEDNIDLWDFSKSVQTDYMWPEVQNSPAILKEWYDFKLNISVARCARISYNNVDGSSSTVEKDLELFDKLIVSRPLHASPAEHQARVPFHMDYLDGHMSVRHELNTYEIEKDHYTTELITMKGKYFSNLQGWIQYRKILEEQFKNN